MLLPSSTNEVIAGWQGPYQVLCRTGKANHLVDMHNKHKRKRIFHVNMLRKWYVPTTTSYWAEELEEDGNDEVPEWRGGAESPEPQAVMGEQLTDDQRGELEELLKSFQRQYRVSQDGRDWQSTTFSWKLVTRLGYHPIGYLMPIVRRYTRS